MKFLDPYNLISLQHELIMSIGTYDETDEILKCFSLRAIKTLNLKRIHIIQKEDINLDIKDQVFSIPPLNNSFLEDNNRLAKYRYSQTPTNSEYIEEIKCDRTYFYCFSIKNLGFMFLERRLKPFGESLLQALVAPISRFGMAYLNKHQFLLNIKQKETIEEISMDLELDKLKFETILGAISDSVIAINIYKEIIFANNSAYKFLNTGFKCKEFTKKYYEYFRLYELVGNKDITRSLELLAIKDKKWSPEDPVLFKAKGLDPIVCEIKVQEIKSKNSKTDEGFYVITFHDITEAYEMEKFLSWQASHDPLTEINNRIGFDREFEAVINDKKSEHHALICLDLDRFKHVNDIGGHLAGDNLLKQVSCLIQREMGENDVLGRIGGDEFCILLKNCTMEYAKDISERVLETIKRLRFQWDDNIFTIGVSIGLTEITPKDTDSGLIFFRADEACMRSKQNGRNQVSLSQDLLEPKENSTSKINYINYINKSLASDESDFNFILYQQQIKSLSDKEKDHIEILLRMNYKDKVILPNAFLPSAERYGMVSSIDYWVVKNALEYLENDDSMDVNVNLSGVTLSDRNALREIKELIEDHPKAAKSLCLEITETAIITNLTKCLKFMEIMGDLGVTFALDDFGTGLSSFGNLKNLPVKYLKIDGSFIRDIYKNEIDQIVVKSINEAAKAMKLKTVAEFVENQSIYDVVSDIGLDFAQGFHLNEPEILQLH